MLTWSLGWTLSPPNWLAMAAITSLALVCDEVPEPVWKTSIGNWSSCLPSAISSAAAAIRCPRSASRRPSSAFVRAAAAFMRPSQRMTDRGMCSPETGKFSTAFLVSVPHNSSFDIGASCKFACPKLYWWASPDDISAPDDISTLDASDLAALIRSRELSSREAVEAHVRRIESANPRLNAVVVTRFEEALREAAAADASSNGQEQGPL